MAGPDFHQTVMGRTFFEGTMPALVRELRRLNDNIEKLIKDKEEPKKDDANGFEEK